MYPKRKASSEGKLVYHFYNQITCKSALFTYYFLANPVSTHRHLSPITSH